MNSSHFLHICSANPDLFLKLVPETDNVKEIAKLCLVNKTFRDFLFSTLAGRYAWLRTASLVTGYEGSKIIDIRVSDFQYQLKLLVCPWLSEISPMLFDFPLTSDPHIKEISTICNSRLLIRILEDADYGDSSNKLPLVFSIPSKPCRTRKELKTAVVKLPQDVENLDRLVISDEQVNDWDQKQIIPSFFDVTDHAYKYINENTVAVIESAVTVNCITSHQGGIYFMSVRESVEYPTMLRHFNIPSVGNRGECEICTAPQKLWLTTSNGLLYFGPQQMCAPLICDSPTAILGRMTPAFWMAYKGQTEKLIKFMREDLHGVDINTKGLLNDRSVLYYAVLGENPETVRFLISARSDVNQADKEDISPLMVATSNVDIECVKLLCSAGADVNWHGEGSTPAILYTADGEHKLETSEHEVTSVLDTLLSYGADPNVTDSIRRSVLFNAGVVKYAGAIRTLVGGKANQYLRDRNGNSLLHVFLSSGQLVEIGDKSIEVINTIVQTMGININATNNFGMTALFMNIHILPVEVVHHMVRELKADLSVKSNQGMTVYEVYLKVNTRRFSESTLHGYQEILKTIKG
jgi:ankyrin repeat protein